MATNLPLIFNHFLQAHWRWRYLHPDALERYQEKKAQRIVAYAAQRSPFYRQHWSTSDLHDWRSLPTVNKQIMMEHFDTFNTLGISGQQATEIALQAERSRDFTPDLHGVTIGLSSGTSGHRGLFLAGPREQAIWAGTILARSLHRVPRRPLRIAFFLRSNNNLYEQIGRTFLQFRYFDLMLPLEDAVAALNSFQPDLLVAPPSLLGFLAVAQRNNTLHIYPERLISVAEVLEPHDRERLQATFNAPVHQIYQCTEGLLAISCAAGSLHIQEDLVALQFESISPADPDSISSPSVSSVEGERVMPIVTDLWRTTQPIIRYRLNDVLQLESQPCSCGSSFRVIRCIEGRCDDICHFYTLAGGIRPFFPDTIRRMILLASPDIQDYQVMQNQVGYLHIYLTFLPTVSFDTIRSLVQTSVDATIAYYTCQKATILIEAGLPPLATGVKRCRVQCSLHL